MKKSARANRPSVAVAPATKVVWPEGATAGIMLVAAACLALSAALYQVAGPREVFAQSQDVGMQAMPSPSGSSSFR